ncbi:sulfatase [Maribacter sp. 4G9]|uniref:sulfatase family protein n=1 Tax=Maribacter sp. 4G9 TaxID=1889777 RepID=UPI000C150DC4|nr:sulfatase [Maribacter sp. 4G9]PIB39379.1 heparan N-sulfatase [Maribacter sp. 4G9]
MELGHQLHFKNIVSLLFLLLFSISCHAQQNQVSKPPNILFMIADDWSYPHAGVYGDKVVRTPTFDGLAKNGAVFENAYCAAPSCSPSRASILLGKYPHQLESAGNLWSVIPSKFTNWMRVLESNGYHTGKSRKGWGPGDFEAGGYTHNPAGKDYDNFKAFLEARENNRPFAFWFGSQDPHRDYETNAGVKMGMDGNLVTVPGFLPDVSCVRNDILDYYFEVERFDRECGNILEQLQQEGLLENTLVIMTSDNGMPFPRAKANLYDYGTRMPLAMYWKGHIEGGRRIADFVNFIDFAPTLLEAAGLPPEKEFSGTSLMSLFNSDETKGVHDKVFLERERHANVRKGNLSYPSRAVRTHEYLYIRNFEPDRWPAGDPTVHQSVGQYGDVDNSITKYLIMQHKESYKGKPYFQWAFGKRPDEELYVLANDPYNLENVATDPGYVKVLETLREELAQWMEATGDLRAKDPKTPYWDRVLYTPNYQMENKNISKEIQAYKQLVRDGGGFKEVRCLD